MGRTANVFADLIVVVNFLFAPAAASAYRDINFAVLWSAQARLDYFKAWRGQRFVPAVVNARRGDAARVLFNTSGVAGLKGEMLFNSYYNRSIQFDIARPPSIDGVAWALKKHRITHVVLPAGVPPTWLSQITQANGSRLFATGGIELWELRDDFTTNYRSASSPQAAENLEAWKRVGKPRFLSETQPSASVDPDNYIAFDFDAGPALPYTVRVGFSCPDMPSGVLRVEIKWFNFRNDRLGAQSERLPCNEQGRATLGSKTFIAPAASFTAHLTLRGDGATKADVTSVRIAE